jgi:hypothetical protein
MDVILTYLHAAVATIVSDHCADVLVRDMDVTDSECLKRSLSKALGYAVVLGAVIGKSESAPAHAERKPLCGKRGGKTV